mmetsp:Transcript_71585/g.173353  ORF Transcript_71585/g.173353 Transcript_71585/m.173353 type:complete len:242 (+) Transcript_71585:118-843(+)
MRLIRNDLLLISMGASAASSSSLGASSPASAAASAAAGRQGSFATASRELLHAVVISSTRQAPKTPEEGLAEFKRPLVGRRLDEDGLSMDLVGDRLSEDGGGEEEREVSICSRARNLESRENAPLCAKLCRSSVLRDSQVRAMRRRYSMRTKRFRSSTSKSVMKWAAREAFSARSSDPCRGVSALSGPLALLASTALSSASGASVEGVRGRAASEDEDTARWLAEDFWSSRAARLLFSEAT